MSYTVEINGVTKTWAGWGLADVRRTRASFAVDTVTATRPVAKWDTATDIAVGHAVLVLQDGVPWFRGRVDQVAGQVSGASQANVITVVGPWWWLDQIPYLQFWRVWQSTSLGYDRSGRVLLGWSGSGYLTTGAQVGAICAWAIDRGAPFQVGTVANGMYIPVDEARDLYCGEAIRRVLRAHPDWVGWFDYSTNPPTFNCGPRASLTAKSIALTGGWAIGDLRSREDLQATAVAIVFERANATNGKREVVVEIAPEGATGLEIGVIRATVSLESPTTGGSSVDLVTEPIDAAHADPATRVAWWKRWWPGLNDPKVTDITIDTVKVDGSADTAGALAVYPRALTEGQTSDELTPDNASVKQTWTAIATLQYDGNEAHVQMSATITATDAETGTYESNSGGDGGESYAQFAGMAETLYQSFSVLHWDGSVSRVAAALPSATDDIGPGHALNITGTGRSGLSTMRALVQSVTESVDHGRTEIRFGPPRHLGPGDLIELLRSFRGRKRETPRAWQSSGQIGATAPPPLGAYFAGGNSSSGLPTYTAIVLKKGDEDELKKVTIDPADLAVDDRAKFREMISCSDNVYPPIKVRQMVLATEGTVFVPD